MTKTLLIVFVKNIKLGKVKTRLAKTIGNQAAFEVYSELVKITENVTEHIDIDKRIYFSDAIVDSKWKNHYKTVQNGEDLGQRMQNAFNKGFEDGYDHIVLIGSDLPEINSEHIKNGLKALVNSDVVFGPAEDGGYYLIGLSNMQDFIFTDKPWSQSNLLNVTLKQLKEKNLTYTLLETLNDIDTYEDLIASNFYNSNTKLKQRIQQIND
ncbi:hypothetical protein A9Q87_02505 [Flavobacteriales bacterium 34_180_T64]|nr:hypothetical protein A9Q87_02505 [Flavobacteriales bacterium 34_180_T64]